MTDLLDARVRIAAFRWLGEQTRVHGEVLPWGLLLAGFTFDGRRVPLVSQQGIFKPRVLPELPLSIRTSVGGPYDDAHGRDELLLYAYRGTDPEHPDNRRLREAMRRRVPLVYLFGLLAGRYLSVWPVYVVGDDPAGLHVTIAADDSRLPRLTQADALPTGASYSEESELRRRYVTREVRQRLHQQEFRERVLEAYRQQCALCRLRHPELLDAAHIIPDAEERGAPVVRNGLSLCRLHHAAYDSYLLAVRPDYTVEVSRSVLAESDGPMLRHGLQAMHGVRILTPRAPEKRPDRDLLSPLQGRDLFRRPVRGQPLARVRPGLLVAPPRLPLGGAWTPSEALAVNTLMADRGGRCQICGPNAFDRYGLDERMPSRYHVYNTVIST